MLCRHDDEERVVAIFAHQIQHEYYDGNTLVSIEGTKLEHFSATFQETSSSSSHICTRHAVFHYFLSDNSKQDAAKTATHRKQIIEMLKNI